MVKEKRKNGSLSNSSTLAFILLWSASYAVGLGMLWLTQDYVRYDTSFISQFFRQWNFASFFIVFALMIPGLMQSLLVRRILQGSSRVWINLMIVGISISWLLLHLLQGLVSGASRYENTPFWIFSFIVFMPVTLVQMIWLAQKVKWVWLWLITSLIGAHVFSSTILNRGVSFPIFVLAGALYGLIMGSAMFYLHIDALWHSEPFQGD